MPFPEEHCFISVEKYFPPSSRMTRVRSTNTDMLQQAFYSFCGITTAQTISQPEFPPNLTLIKYQISSSGENVYFNTSSLPRQNLEY